MFKHFSLLLLTLACVACAASLDESKLPSDAELEKTYYFRWWTFRKHVKKTPAGYVITEFLPNVHWAGGYNTINCPASHHIREARWLADKSIVTDYARFWMTDKSAQPRKYSFPAAESTLQLFAVTLDKTLIQQQFGALCETYRDWEGDHRDSTGLFWQSAAIPASPLPTAATNASGTAPAGHSPLPRPLLRWQGACIVSARAHFRKRSTTRRLRPIACHTA